MSLPLILIIEIAPVPGMVAGAAIVLVSIIELRFPRIDLVHIVQQVFVGLVLIHQLEHEVHRLGRVHVGEKLAEYPDAAGSGLVEKKVVTACS